LQGSERISGHAILFAESKAADAERVHGAEKHSRGQIAVLDAGAGSTRREN
jgi:hypothetical protein